MEMLNEILVNVFDLLQGVALTLAQGLRKFFISRKNRHKLSSPSNISYGTPKNVLAEL